MIPIEQIPGSDVRYYFVAVDGAGRDRKDDPARLMSQRVANELQEKPVTNVFVMSHGRATDGPSPKPQYAARIGAILACADDLAHR